MATISEGINFLKTLQIRHNELVTLRNENSATTRQRYGDTTTERTPAYDVKKLDRRITLIARELRLLNDAIKKANAVTELKGFTIDDAVLGELEDADTPDTKV